MREKWNSVLPLSAEECLAYFREYPVFEQLFSGFREKYTSYGSLSGKVVLRGLKGQEIETLEGFFHCNFHGKKSVTISAQKFEKALSESRFAEFSGKQILEWYFGEALSGRREQREEKDKHWQELYDSLLKKYENTHAVTWLSELQQRKEGMHSWLVKQDREAEDDLQTAEALLELGARIVNALPCYRQETEYLAVFAAGMTGNPHAFDDGTRDGRFLYQITEWVSDRMASESAPVQMQTQEWEKAPHQERDQFSSLRKQQIYYQAGILRDDISNYVTISGIRAWKRNGEIHAGIEGFYQEGDCVQIPLSVIAGWGRISCPENQIYILENPSVYALFSRKWKGKRASMCMNGQPRFSALLVLDLLAKEGVHIYYAGDFDPEGLLISQKLKSYYRGTFSYWNMTCEDYEHSISKEPLSQRRLRMLDGVIDPELAEVVAEMREKKMAGYQENLLSH